MIESSISSPSSAQSIKMSSKRVSQSEISNIVPYNISSDFNYDTPSRIPVLLRSTEVSSRKRNYSSTLGHGKPHSIQGSRAASSSKADNTRLRPSVAPLRSISDQSCSQPKTSSSDGNFSFHAPFPASLSLSYKLHTFPLTQASSPSVERARNRQTQRSSHASQLRSSSRSTKEGEKEKEIEGPPIKRRKGMKSILVDGALTAAVITGAAAITAVSLWSNWGKSREQASRKSSKEFDPNTTTVKKMVHTPPPPYIEKLEQSRQISRQPLSPLDLNRSHLRRPRDDPIYQEFTHSSSSPIDGVFFSSSPLSSERHNNDEDDDAFVRLREQMERLVNEGRKALHSTPNLNESEIQRHIQSEDTVLRTPSRVSMHQISTYQYICRK